jgi:hypothetical protein
MIFHAGVGEGADFFTVTIWDSPEAYDAFAPIFTKMTTDMGFHFGKPHIFPVHQSLSPAGG